MRNIDFFLALSLASIVSVLGSAPPACADVQIPVGTPITVTLAQTVSSANAAMGQRVDGNLSSAVSVGRNVVIPRGSRVRLSVADVDASGRLQTPGKLYLKVDSIEVAGKTYAVSTRLAGETANSHAKRNAVAIGGGSALGAMIGGIAGGGKGALIGAGAGAGAGTAGAAATGKKDVVFPAETKLRFTTRAAVNIKQ
jgi:hypothetical protein